MNMYQEYWAEEENKNVISVEDGFIAFQYVEKTREFFITDMFVKPEKRHTGIGQELGKMAEVTAKEFGAKELTCNVWVKDPVVTTRKIRIFNEFGFNIVACGNGYITMRKEI